MAVTWLLHVWSLCTCIFSKCHAAALWGGVVTLLQSARACTVAAVANVAPCCLWWVLAGAWSGKAHCSCSRMLFYCFAVSKFSSR
jgi:hypothetical protein